MEALKYQEKSSSLPGVIYLLLEPFLKEAEVAKIHSDYAMEIRAMKYKILHNLMVANSLR
jgi:hypothetical protein